MCASFHAPGRLNQAEYSERIDPILASETGEKEHYHNQLISAIYGNVTREMPDQGLAPWVSANDKPTAATGTKPVSGDAAERRLKGEVMQLPSRDRRRIKDLMQNEVRPPTWLWLEILQHADTFCASSTPTTPSHPFSQTTRDQKLLEQQKCKLVSLVV